MKDSKKEFWNENGNAIAFIIGFLGFQVIWYFILLPLIK